MSDDTMSVLKMLTFCRASNQKANWPDVVVQMRRFIFAKNPCLIGCSLSGKKQLDCLHDRDYIRVSS